MKVIRYIPSSYYVVLDLLAPHQLMICYLKRRKMNINFVDFHLICTFNFLQIVINNVLALTFFSFELIRKAHLT